MFRKQYSINLKLLLIVILIFIGMASAFIGIKTITTLSYSTNITNIRNDVQNRGLILADKISRNNYLSSDRTNTQIKSDMNLVADIYDGRAVLIDSSYKIIEDTFGISTGKYSIAPEVIKCFQGETSNKYDDERDNMIQTFPVYTPGEDNKKIIGTLLITVSTQSAQSFSDTVNQRANLLLLIIFVILIPVSVVTSIALMGPFEKLIMLLRKTSSGAVIDDFEENAYDVTRDISASINGTIKRLEEIDDTKSEFVSNVSHELKTPITSIRVLADSLMNMGEVPNELYKEFMEDISIEVDREARIIDDLLELVKMDKSAPTISPKPVDLVALMKLVLKRVRPIAEKKNVELLLEQVREVSIEGDETKLMLAFMNIVENGVKYNVEGGKVHVKIDSDHRDAFISISDTGIGIPAEYKKLIFERFYRVDKARSRENGGTGLGLAISKNIVQMHHGTIEVNSEVDKGTEFIIRIPTNYIA